MPTTSQMNMVIQQVMQAQDMGNLASFYFEAKMAELLALQLHQTQKQEELKDNSFRRYSDQINEAKFLLETHYNQPLTIAALSQNVGMSESMLKAGFKSYFGTTIFNYLFNCRMNMATSFLVNDSLSVAEIALKTGYEYPSHFATAFKRKFAMSPTEFRTKSLR